MRNQKGFTLIELIIVIVVLGILAVTAAPQFFNFSGDARESAVKGLKGNIQGAYQTVYAKAAVEGKLAENDGAADSPQALSDSGITLKYGYPTVDGDGDDAVDANGIVKAATLGDSSAQGDWVYAIESTGGNLVIAPASIGGLSDPATATEIAGTNCYVSYTEAKSADAAPVVTAETSGCGN